MPEQERPIPKEISQKDHNQLTLSTYEQNIDKYIETTPQEVSGDLKEWIDKCIDGLPKNARILEIGSGFGRDADYIESLGYQVERTDAARSFVELLDTLGHDAKQLNILTDEIEEKYDMVFANAVLLHFDKSEINQVLEKIGQSLNPNGRFAFTVKTGEGSEWSNSKIDAPRFFQYWQADELDLAVRQNGFNNCEIAESGEAVTWLHVIAEKQSNSLETN